MGKPTVPGEPLRKDGKQILTLRVMVLQEASSLKAPPPPPSFMLLAPPLWDHTHTDTCNHLRRTRTLKSRKPIFKQRDTHSPLSVFKEEIAIDPDWFPVLYYPRCKLQLQLHKWTKYARVFIKITEHTVYISCIWFILLGSLWALTYPMLSNLGLSAWPLSTMWNVNDVLS